MDSSNAGVCDLFAGTGTISYALSKSRSVTAVDIQEYSRVLCSAQLHPVSYPYNISSFIDQCVTSNFYDQLNWALIPIINYESACVEKALADSLEPLCEFLEKSSLISCQMGYKTRISTALQIALSETLKRLKETGLANESLTVTTRHFGGAFFSFKQAVALDVLLKHVFELPLIHRDTFLAAVLSTTSDIVNTVGKQFAQPINPRNSNGHPKTNLVKMVNKDRGVDVFPLFGKWLTKYLSIEGTGFTHTICKSNYLEALNTLPSNIRVIYADPPYTRDHYSRFYHVLETMCLRDNPDVSTAKKNGAILLSRGHYRANRYQSPFCIRSQAFEAFEKMVEISKNKGIKLLISYSPYDDQKKAHPRLLTIPQIESLTKKYYSKVRLISPGAFSHSKFNNSEKNFEITYKAELLIACE